MRTIETIHRSGIGIGPDRTIREAAKIMAAAGVGSLAVLDQERLIGIVTDRDLVRRCVARGIEPGARVDSAMSTPVVTIQADADVHDAFGLFRTHAVRRLAVVRGEQFVGMLAIDDLLVYLAADLADLARPITAEILFAHRDSPVPATI
jgi:CBS domain-containing protein